MPTHEMDVTHGIPFDCAPSKHPSIKVKEVPNKESLQNEQQCMHCHSHLRRRRAHQGHTVLEPLDPTLFMRHLGLHSFRPLTQVTFHQNLKTETKAVRAVPVPATHPHHSVINSRWPGTDSTTGKRTVPVPSIAGLLLVTGLGRGHREQNE